jgi:hypothetical protein
MTVRIIGFLLFNKIADNRIHSITLSASAKIAAGTRHFTRSPRRRVPGSCRLAPRQTARDGDQRLTPGKLVAAFAPPTGAVLGHRRNHAKGICFTGVFEANGAGSELSQARVFVNGQYPVLGRFNLGTANPNAPDATVRVRGLAKRISTPDGQEWRSAMIDPPVFTVATPEAFYELLRASESKNPNAMETFAAAHPEFATFADWAKNGPWTGSYAEDRFNSLDSFVFVNGSGVCCGSGPRPALRVADSLDDPGARRCSQSRRARRAATVLFSRKWPLRGQVVTNNGVGFHDRCTIRNDGPLGRLGGRASSRCSAGSSFVRIRNTQHSLHRLKYSALVT